MAIALFRPAPLSTFMATIAVVLSVLAGATADAGPIVPAPTTRPTGLDPGGQYRLAFVTSSSIDATSSNIGDYNAFVAAVANSVAQIASLGTTWKAIASTNSVDARDNTGTNPLDSNHASVPIYLLDGTTMIAVNNVDLWDGGLSAPLDITEYGPNSPVNNFVFGVWTGSTVTGTKPNPIYGALGTDSPRMGDEETTGAGWINNALFSPTERFSLYALSDVLTVPGTPIPAPTTLALNLVGLGALAVIRRKRPI